MVQSSLQLQKCLASRFDGAGYRCAGRLLSASTIHIVVENDMWMQEDVP